MIYLTQQAQKIFKTSFKRLQDVKSGVGKGGYVVALQEDNVTKTSDNQVKKYSMYELCFNKSIANRIENQQKRVFWQGICDEKEFIQNIYAILLKSLKLRILCQERVKGKADVIFFSKSEMEKYEDKKTADTSWPCAEVSESKDVFFRNEISKLRELSSVVEEMTITQ